MQKLYTCILYGLQLSIVNKNVKSDKSVNTLWLQKVYMKLKICEKVFKVRENKHAMKNKSESQYNTMHSIWSLEIHHNFP